ncbi:MAG: hypothetical protein LBD78_03885 [Spirochaetaceae bacterium]|jgi:hypothetical protein|nr:hypothetical protein [Spirochaetaceae bacterium]
MDKPQEENLFLTIEDVRTIFPRLKSMESGLFPRERRVLLKIEGILYEYHSVEEIENLLNPSGGVPSL